MNFDCGNIPRETMEENSQWSKEKKAQILNEILASNEPADKERFTGLLAWLLGEYYCFSAAR